ncbi:hypothetical protein ACHAXS_011452 [Conticribra weissflogii]
MNKPTESFASTASAASSSSSAAAPTATPNSRKRHFAPTISLEFANGTGAAPRRMLPRKIGSLKKDESFDESDTDVGSHVDGDDDESYDFQCEESDDEDHGKKSNSWENTPGTVSRVGAKVRRLDLGEAKGSGGLFGGGGGWDMDVKKSFHSGASTQRYGTPAAYAPRSNKKLFSSKSRIGEMTPVMESPCPKSPFFKSGEGKTAHLRLPSFSSPPSSPNNVRGAKLPSLLVCPPSTAKKSGKSRIFHTEDSSDDGSGFQLKMRSSGKNEKDDDVSPRDVANFPFFSPDSPNEENEVAIRSSRSMCRVVTTQARGNHAMTHSPENPTTGMKKPNRRADIMAMSPPRGQRSFGRADSFIQIFNKNDEDQPEDSAMEHSPLCPSTTKKLDPRIELSSRSPPEGSRMFGRANSFMQMFSQDSLVGLNFEDDCEDDDFIHRPNEKAPPIQSKNSPPPFQRKGAQSTPVDLSPAQGSSSFSRFAADFEVVGTLGNGSFGCVYKVRNRMDRRMYAIKAAKREARGISDRDRMLQEVYALAALSDNTTTEAMHIVRYHQAWMEGNRLYIQTELCQSTLTEEVSKGVMDEKRRYKLLREMLLALDLVHKSGMIHLDIKPENIFIKNDQYKLGDFGLVSKIENHNDVEEGDSRYMSMELLSGDLDDLTKSDIFSLGATLYEICLGRNLPENGQEWQDIRHGSLSSMPNTAFELQMIIRIMMAPDKKSRPSAAELLTRRQLLSDEQRQLIVERNKAEAANMALDAQMKRFELLSPRKRAFHRSNTIS